MTGATVAAPRRLGFGFWSFIAFMLALTALFVVLGVWQIERLAWKEGLIADVDQRMHAAPIPLPPPGDWATLDPDAIQYHPVTVTGTFVPAQTVLVFTSLAAEDARGRASGPGYWVMTPLQRDGGGVVFIDRGFIPQAAAKDYATGGEVPAGPQTLTGIALPAEAAGPFTPAADVAGRIDWIRDPARLAALLDPGLTPVAPIFVDLPAGPPGALPQGGETMVEFPNDHLGYAMTWFGFALLTPCLLAYWIYRQLRPAGKQA